MVESAIIHFYRADQVHLWIVIAVVVPAFFMWLCTFFAMRSAVYEAEARYTTACDQIRQYQRNAEEERRHREWFKQRHDDLLERIAQLLPDDEDDE